MRITMIGDSAVGKTTFMMSTYGLMRDGIQGFKVKCTNKQADTSLYNAYQEFRKHGTYPDATVQMSSYNYNFYTGRDFVMNFSLTDIRGESIYDIDVSQLHREIKRSDAVMLFLSAYDIINGVDIEDSIDQLYTHLNNALQVDDRQKLLMVVFTQSDRIEWEDDTFETLMETVSDLKRITDRNNNLLFAAIPTACAPNCMMDLDYAMALLMLIGYYREVSVEQDRLNEEVEAIKRKWGEGLWNAITDFFGVNYERDEARKRLKKLQDEEIPKFEKMQKKFQKLEQFCDDYELGTTYSVKHSEDPFSF